MSIEPLADKLRAFNLDVFETQNGHDGGELVDVFNRMNHQRRGKPLVLVLNTIKGKKVRQCQYNPNWHTSAPRNAPSAGMWLEEIWDQDGKRLNIPEDFHAELTKAIEIMPPLHDNPDEMVDHQM